MPIFENAPKAMNDLMESVYSACTQVGGDEVSCSRQAIAAAKKAGWRKEEDRWVHEDAMKKKELYEIPAVEIFGTGKHHGFRFSPEIVAQMVADTNAQVGREPFLRIGHKKDGGGEDSDPRVGALKNIRFQAGKIVADLVNVPARVLEAIHKGGFPKRSIELIRDYKDKAGNVIPWLIDSVALLGAAHPEVKDLQDIGTLYAAEDGSCRLSIETPTGWLEVVEMDDNQGKAAEEKDLVEEHETEKGEEESNDLVSSSDDSDRLAELEAENERLRAELETAHSETADEADERGKMSERIARLEARNAVLRFADRIPPAERDEVENRLLRLRKIDVSMKFSEKESEATRFLKELEKRPPVRFGEDNGPGDGPDTPGKPGADRLKKWGFSEEEWDKLSPEYKEQILA